MSSAEISPGEISPGVRAARALRVQWAVGGLLTGALWALQSGRPLWEILLRMAILMPLVQGLIALSRAAARRRGRVAAPRVPARRLVVQRVCLIAVAFVLTVVLEAAGADGATYIAAGLTFLFAAAFGPFLHSRLYRSGVS